MGRLSAGNNCTRRRLSGTRNCSKRLTKSLGLVDDNAVEFLGVVSGFALSMGLIVRHQGGDLAESFSLSL